MVAGAQAAVDNEVTDVGDDPYRRPHYRGSDKLFAGSDGNTDLAISI